ncbi:MAG: hypothetical protein P8K79_11760, partial [Mariniblastus sp.]|nr:hypothetical protein [Mariniblastus sp.]
AGPWIAGDAVLLKLDDDQLLSLDADLNQKWSLPIPNDRLACPPFEEGGVLNVVFQSGKMWLIDAASGEVKERFDLGEPIVGRPFKSGGNTYFSGFDGTIHVIETP